MLALTHLGGFGIPAAVPVPPDPLFANVVLLLQPTAGASTVADVKEHGVAAAGVVLDADAPVPGVQSMRFDGTAAHLRVEDDGAFDLPGDFTIEMFVRLDSRAYENGYARRLLDAGGYGVYVSSSTGAAVLYGLATVEGAAAVDGGVWRHLAIERSGGLVGLAVGGAFGTATPVAGTLTCTASSLTVGANEALTAGRLSGRIAGLRVTRGVARYGLAGFVPPATVFAIA